MLKNVQGALIDDPEAVANCFAKSLAVTLSESNDPVSSNPLSDENFLSFLITQLTVGSH